MATERRFASSSRQQHRRSTISPKKQFSDKEISVLFSSGETFTPTGDFEKDFTELCQRNDLAPIRVTPRPHRPSSPSLSPPETSMSKGKDSKEVTKSNAHCKDIKGDTLNTKITRSLSFARHDTIEYKKNKTNNMRVYIYKKAKEVPAGYFILCLMKAEEVQCSAPSLVHSDEIEELWKDQSTKGMKQSPTDSLVRWPQRSG
eukprot:gene2394-2754_t